MARLSFKGAGANRFKQVAYQNIGKKVVVEYRRHVCQEGLPYIVIEAVGMIAGVQTEDFALDVALPREILKSKKDERVVRRNIFYVDVISLARYERREID